MLCTIIWTNVSMIVICETILWAEAKAFVLHNQRANLWLERIVFECIEVVKSCMMKFYEILWTSLGIDSDSSKVCVGYRHLVSRKPHTFTLWPRTFFMLRIKQPQNGNLYDSTKPPEIGRRREHPLLQKIAIAKMRRPLYYDIHRHRSAVIATHDCFFNSYDNTLTWASMIECMRCPTQRPMPSFFFVMCD